MWFYDSSMQVSTCRSCFIIFDFVDWITGSNMPFYINDNLILHYHMDAFKSTMLQCRYLVCPDYMVVQGWIRATLLSPTDTILARPSSHQYIKFFSGTVRYLTSGFFIVPCHHLVAVLHVTNDFIVRAFPITSFQMSVYLYI